MKPQKRAKDKTVILAKSMLRMEVWSKLDSAARDIYIELKLNYNGYNNGALIASYRYLRKKYSFGFNRIKKGFLQLIQEGFIEVARIGELEGLNGKRAAQYRLTGKYEKLYEQI